jgi:cobaltochelatase CobT
VDRCTLEANTDKQILDRHLRAVIEEIERDGAIELAALGVKHNTTLYYRKSVEIRDSESLGSGLIGMVDRLLSFPRRAGSGF